MKQFSGMVVSDKMDKTVVVEVRSMWTHPVYKKTVSRTKNYLVHDLLGAKTGDNVLFEETRPLSKRKRFITKIILGREAKGSGK